ncbi:MFS transporter [Halalkalibacillus sediminis]|uniref:MFS transporter n=1 Tax=Halalkalibacillus sediminis TaxID=2018042 RepID=A0A2I0QRR1_9BACI|nr:MFS transporter [Halalkalibacillus sediminis]PKR77018.1 MFS transporter [Halalkalibacillus sediminis]
MLSKNKVMNTPFYYGWVVVAVAGLSVFFSGPGQTFAISTFIDYYIEEFDYSRSYVSGLYSGATLLAGFLLFIIGRLTDRFGQRIMMTAIGTALALATFWNAAIVGPVMMFFGFFMLRIFGQGSMTLLPNTLVPQWFLEKRGRALSVMAIGGFAGAAFIPPLNYFMIEQLGWRAAWSVWGIALLVLFVPFAIMLVRNQPSEIDEIIDGRRRGKVSQKQVSRFPLFTAVSIVALIGLTIIPPIDRQLTELFSWMPPTYIRILLTTAAILVVFWIVKRTPKKSAEFDHTEEEDNPVDNEVNWTLKEAMRTKAFWVILGCISIPALTNTGITFHIFSIMEGKSLSPEIASFVLSLMAIIGFPVTFVSGYLVDKYKVHYILSATFAIHILAILWLWYTQTATGAIIYGVLWGVAHGFERITLNIIWPNYFGRRHLGSIKSIAQSVMVVGSALGPLPYGLFYDVMGGYSEVLLLTPLLPLIAGILVLTSPPPKYEDYHS